MNIFINGLDLETGRPRLAPVDRDELGARLLSALVDREDQIKRLASNTSNSTTFRGQIERERSPDLGDPAVVGWTILVGAEDPQRDDLIAALEPLARHRGMADIDAPLIFPAIAEDEWFDWLQDNYLTIDRPRPYYVLIAAGPEHVPFHFQARLDSAAAVGRLDLDTLDDVRAYVDKVLRSEGAPQAPVDREALFFAPDGGRDDATYFSHHYLAKPLAQRCAPMPGIRTQSLFGADARKERLLGASGGCAAVVFTASHGAEAGEHASLENKRRLNGAICCQNDAGGPPGEWLLTAADVAADGPFFEGSVFFQFGCFGYGTPAESDFGHWAQDASPVNATQDFTAALPKRLIAHPSGPLGVVAHLDLAWLHGFDDPMLPHPIERWHPRISPFAHALDELLGRKPVGLAMAQFNERFDLTNAQLASTVDRLKRGRLQDTPQLRARLADVFVLRSDAQNYMVLGDPAVRARPSD